MSEKYYGKELEWDEPFFVDENGNYVDLQKHYQEAAKYVESLPTYAEKIRYILSDYPNNTEWKKITEENLRDLEAIKEKRIPVKKVKEIYYKEYKYEGNVPGLPKSESYWCDIIYIGKSHVIMYQYRYNAYEEKNGRMKAFKDKTKLKDKKIIHEIGGMYETNHEDEQSSL